MALQFVFGPYIERDLKRLKKISSLNLDLENHYKIFRGKVQEKIINCYQVPLASAFLYKTDISSEITILFFKDRCATTNPFMPPSNGLRIIFGLFLKNSVPFQYTPFIVFTAREEGGKYFCPNGKSYPLTSSNFKYIIEAKLEYYDE